MLTPKEDLQLRKLMEKSKDLPKPLEESDLLEMQQRVDKVYDDCPNLFRDLAIAGWNQFSSNLESLAADNSRLIGEIKRIQTEQSTPTETSTQTNTES